MRVMNKKSGLIVGVLAIVVFIAGWVVLQGNTGTETAHAADKEKTTESSPRVRKIQDAPPFSVPSRKEELEMFPCSECHEDEPINRRERKLEEEHEDMVLDHGGGRFWCITCHGSEKKDTFLSMNNTPIDFDQAYLLCGQCHYDRQKDWFFGAHGKRLTSWQGEREILSCTACHDAHSPSIKPFEPSPPPKVRSGLTLKVWDPKKHLPKWKTKTQGGEAH